MLIYRYITRILHVHCMVYRKYAVLMRTHRVRPYRPIKNVNDYITTYYLCEDAIYWVLHMLVDLTPYPLSSVETGKLRRNRPMWTR